jgi:hypothetical protein
MMYLLVSQHVSALAVLQQTRGEEVVRCALVGIGFTTTAARTVLYTIGVVGFVLFS